MTLCQWYSLAAALLGMGAGFNLAVAIVVLIFWRLHRASER